MNLPMTKQLGHPQMIPVAYYEHITKTCDLVQEDSSVKKSMHQMSLHY